jgi:proline racemase
MFVKNQIHAIDHHHGQANRTVLSGYPTIRGATMREKEAFYLENMSWIHECMCREPRGHSAMLGSILTDPVEEGSAFGVLFLHANGLFDGCGDSTLGTAAAAVETGLVPADEPVTRFAMDTVMGPINLEVEVKGGIVVEVRYDNQPGYHIATTSIDVAEHGRIKLDVSYCGGQWFPQIDAKALGISVDKSNRTNILTFGQLVTDALRKMPEVADPESGEPIRFGETNANVISLYSKQDTSNSYRIANTVAPSFMGRTPGGLPTGALMTLLHQQGKYDLEDKFVNRSPVKTDFRGTGRQLTLPSGRPALATTIGTKSYLMGIHQFVIDPQDPFPNGFIVG